MSDHEPTCSCCGEAGGDMLAVIPCWAATRDDADGCMARVAAIVKATK